MATTTAACRIGRKRVAIEEPNPENLGQRVRGMSNPELLLFGVTTKCPCFFETSPGQSPPDDVLVQLTRSSERVEETEPGLAAE